MGPQIRGVFNVHLKMGSEGKMKNLEQNYENEGGAAKVTTKPVEGGIKDPKSISKNTITHKLR